jgi:polygalacturonase
MTQPPPVMPSPRRSFVDLKTTLILLMALTLASCTTTRQSATSGHGPFTPAAIFNVRSFGAMGDGKTLDSPAINQAIEACGEAGGGMVYLPAGIYLSGSIRLTNNMNLYIGAGATILGAPQTVNAYDPTEPWEVMAYQDGGHTYFHNSLIWGEGLTNVSITGPGMINGGGLVWLDPALNRLSGYSRWSPTNRNATRINLTNSAPLRLGNKAVALKLCRNIIMRDFTIFHGGHFAVLATGCDGMTVDNVTMDTDRDGIDIDCCRNCVVSNCRINSPTDDALCPKSSFALGTNVITENLTIVNCQVSGFVEGTLLDGTMKPARNGNGRIKFGTEANGGFRNVTVANCTFRSCQGLALEEVDGGIMENIAINNLTMMDVRDYPIYITLGNRNRGPGVTNASRGRNILISNVVASGIDRMSGIQITGIPEQPLEGIRLENIRLIFNGGGTRQNALRDPPELGPRYPEPSVVGVMPAYGLFARHVRDLELANIHVSFDSTDLRPAMVCSDVDGLEIDNFKASVAEGVAAARFDGVRRFVLRNSPVLDGIYRPPAPDLK